MSHNTITYLANTANNDCTIIELLEEACAELYKKEQWAAYYKVEQARHMLINKFNAQHLAAAAGRDHLEQFRP